MFLIILFSQNAYLKAILNQQSVDCLGSRRKILRFCFREVSATPRKVTELINLTSVKALLASVKYFFDHIGRAIQFELYVNAKKMQEDARRKTTHSRNCKGLLLLIK